MAGHALFWGAVAIFLLFDAANPLASLSFAIGLSCVATFCAISATSTSRGRARHIGQNFYLAAAVLLLALLALHGAGLRFCRQFHGEALEAILQADTGQTFDLFVHWLALPFVLLWSASIVLLWLTFPRANEPWTQRRSSQIPLVVGGVALLAIGHPIVTEPLLATNRDYRENSRNFIREVGAAGDRVWAHRTNSLGTLLEAKRTFSGIEVDVVFDVATGRFRVHHPPAPDIGLDLRDILAWSRDRPRMKIWLDWKNASPKNVRAALAELIALDRRYQLKDRALVETGSDAVSPELALISQAGFRHGYYLPTKRMASAIRQGRPAMARLAAEIERVVMAGKFEAVTYDARMHPFVEQALDGFLTRHAIRRYSWDQSINTADLDADPVLPATLVRERHLDGLLVTFPSTFRA